jgi:hypothetical protein
MNRHYATPSRPVPSAVVGVRRTTTTPVYPSAPPSRASTSGHGASASGSEVAAVLYHSPHSTSTFTPLPSLGDSSSAVSPSHSHFKSQSPFNNNRPAVAQSPRPSFSSNGTFTPPPSLSGDSSSSVSHSHSHWPFDNNRPAAAQSPRPGFSSDGALSDYAAGAAVYHPVPVAPTPARLARASPSPAVFTPPRALSSSPAPAPSPPLPIPLRAEGHMGPVTPTRNGALNASSSQPHEQQQQRQRQQRQLPQPPSSARSKGSVAETPSGDLANFHLLKGSPLQSVADFDTPTPSPRTPSASPADQALLFAHRTGAAYFALTDGRRFLPGSSGISPTFARAQRAAAATTTIPEAIPSFYCRICQVDPCREITATACGHVFCNACIVEEVRENARCPVCNAAVLLFALLKLDVSQFETYC